MQQQVWRDLFNRRLCKLKSNAINYLNPAHKSGDAWGRIASSVQTRGCRPLILESASCQDCTLEAMRTQVLANQCIECTVVLFAQASFKSEQSRLVQRRARLLRGRPISQPLAYTHGTVPASQCCMFRFRS